MQARVARRTRTRGGAIRVAVTLAILALIPQAALGQEPEEPSLCDLLAPAEIAEAFASKLSVVVQSSERDACVYEIEGRQYSEVRLTRLAPDVGRNVLEGYKASLDDGSIEGAYLDDLGREAVWSLTNQALHVRLNDDRVLALSLSIYFEALRPLLEDVEKRAGMVQLGRLAAQRLTP